VTSTVGEAVGPIAGFGVVAVVAVWVLAAILRGVPSVPPRPHLSGVAAAVPAP
jgi:hypothetical protein